MPVRQAGGGLGGQFSGRVIWQERPATARALLPTVAGQVVARSSAPDANPVNPRKFRYYRLLMSSSPSFALGGFMAISEMELAEVNGGPDTTAGVTITASSTSAGFNPTFAIDDDYSGSFAHSWAMAAGESAPQWLLLDYGATAANWKAINQLKITARDAGAEAQAPSAFILQGSYDGTTFYDLLTQNSETFAASETKTYQVTTRPPEVLLDPARSSSGWTPYGGGLSATATSVPTTNILLKANTDKYTGYFEVTINAIGAGLQIGIEWDDSQVNYAVINDGIGVSSTGAGGNVPSPAFTTGDIFSGFLDENSGDFYIAKNGVWQNGANPSARTGGVVSNSFYPGNKFAPAVSTTGTGADVTFNFGASPFAYAIPATGLSWDGSQIGDASTANNLTATALTSASPAFGAVSVGQVHGLSATALAPSSPALGTPALVQIVALSVTALATASPALGSPAVGQKHALAVTALAVGSPSLGTPTPGQVHALTPSALATGAPALGSPAMGQAHVLATGGTVTAAPALGTPALAQVNALAASPLTTSSPVLGMPAATHVHVLAATALATAAPALGTPAAGQVHALAAAAVATASPAIGTPTLSQIVVLAAVPLAPASPALGTPAAGQKHVLTADPLATASPQIESPAIGQAGSLFADTPDLASPQLGSPALGQAHSLTATALATSAPAIGVPVFNVTRLLAANALATAAPQLGTPPVGQTHGLAANGTTTGAPALGTPPIGEQGELIANPLVPGAPVLGTPTLGQRHALAPVAVVTAAPVLGVPAIGQAHVLLAAALGLGSPAIGTPPLGQVHGLAVADFATAAPVLGIAVLLSVHGLLADGIATGSPSVGSPVIHLFNFVPGPAAPSHVVHSDGRSRDATGTGRAGRVVTSDGTARVVRGAHPDRVLVGSGQRRTDA